MWLKIFAPTKSQHQPDRKMITALVLLIIVGLVMLFSASSVAGYLRSGSSLFFLKRQIFGFLLGVPALLIVSRIDYHIWRKWALPFLVISVGLLLLVFIPGLSASYGRASNWINLFGVSLQPSEFVKIGFLIYLAAWLEVKKNNLDNVWEGLGPFLLVLGVIGFLMLKQPDLGTFAIIFASSVIVYFVAGAKWSHMLLIVLVAVLGLWGVVHFKANKMDRIMCYQNPTISTGDKCYQINQSLIAIGSGGFWGRGLGQSRQKFMYLPEVWCDSIFAIIAEELGFIFSIPLLVLFGWLFWRGFHVSARAPDVFGQLLAVGIVSWMAIQTFLNIGGIINLIPMTGVPLPFISSGGSAILALLIGMGILINISRQTRE